MPQLAVVKYVDDGGKYVHSVVGAVPVIEVAGLVVAVPPVMLDVTPAPDDPSSTQVVVKVKIVLPASMAAVVLMYSGV